MCIECRDISCQIRIRTMLEISIEISALILLVFFWTVLGYL